MNKILKLSADGKTIVEVLDKSVKHITIPEGVEVIGTKAFRDCEALQSVDIPASVAGIDEWAFRDCEALQSVDIPASVVEIGEGILSFCEALQSVHMHNTNIDELNCCYSFDDDVTSKCTLYVPAGTKEAYSNNEEFNEFVIVERE